MKAICFVFFLLFTISSFAQEDTINEKYYNQVITYVDLGYNSFPFDLTVNTYQTLKFRNNINPFVGIGGHYKWFSIRGGILLNTNLRGEDKYGSTSIFKIGTEFTYKRFFVDLDMSKLKGFALVKNSQLGIAENVLYPDLHFSSISANFWYFFDKKFSFNALKGRKQAIKKNNWSFFLKETNAYTSINNSTLIIPSQLQNINSEIKFDRIKAMEIGIIPGLAIALRVKNNYQLGGLLGYGGVLIDKNIHFENLNRNYFGLSGRFDFRLFFGYNVKKYFIMNYYELEQRNINFNSIVLNSTIISYRIIFGYRF